MFYCMAEGENLFQCVKCVFRVAPKFVECDDARFKEGDECGPIVFIEDAGVVQLAIDTADKFSVFILIL